MKINEYNEMMAYLTKPDKKPVIPKSKPKKSTREAYKEYLEIRPFLDAESQMFIEKELGFAMGGSVETPKRGLVDEPGSYAGEGGEIRKTILANIDNIKSDYLKGLTLPSLAEKYLPDKKFKSVNSTLDRELNKVVSKKEKIARSKIKPMVRRNPVFKDPKKLAKFEKDISKLTLKELVKKYKVNKNTVSEYIRSKPELEKTRVLAMSTPEMVNARLKDIVDEIKDIKVSKYLKTNSPEIMKISKNLNRTPGQILSDINKIRLNPNRIKISKDVLNKIDFFPKSISAEDDIIIQGFSPKTAKVVKQVREASAIVTEAASNLEHSLPKSIIREFKLPKKYTLTAERTTSFLNQFKKQFDDQLLKLAQSHARGEINYDQYKEGVNKIRKTVFDKTGGYKIGYVDFVDGKPVPVTEQKSLLKGQGDIGKRTTGLINYFKNSVFHNNLYKNYKANPKDPAFGTLRDEIKKSKFKFVEEIEAEKTFNAIKNFKEPKDFFKFYKQNPDNVFFKALSKVASLTGGKGKLLLGGAATFPFLATALAADEPDTQTTTPVVDEVETQPKLPSFKDTAIGGTAAAVGSKFTKTDPLKKFRRFITAAPVRKGFGKILRGAGTPFGGLALAGTNVLSKMSEGQSLADAVVDPITGLELSFPGLFKENIAKITKNPRLQTALKLGRFGRMLNPVGLGLAALGQGQEFYNQYQALKDLKEQNPRAYEEFISQRVGPALSTAEQIAIEDMGARSGAAGGGIMKMAGKSSGPPPESGPIPQGLDFLLKRGR